MPSKMITRNEAMERAIRLSQQGFPAPNPHVGCVIVKDGIIVGEGAHLFAGGPHAEIAALQEAGDAARGATAFVTLEPCNHTGRTGPCSQALIEAGVIEVNYAVSDPNPRAHGGAEALTAAGVKVHAGLLEAKARTHNRQYLFAQSRRRPRITLKAAISLDGRVALANGESQWITGEDAREAAHRLRAECGAVLVGRGTVEADDPQLTARVPGVVNQPLRIVLDPQSKLSSGYKVFDAKAPTHHVTGEIHLPRLMTELFDSGTMGLLVEGGAKTITEFIRQDLVDRIVLFVAPVILGDGPSWAGDYDLKSLASALRFEIVETEKMGSDLAICLERPT